MIIQPGKGTPPGGDEFPGDEDRGPTIVPGPPPAGGDVEVSSTVRGPWPVAPNASRELESTVLIASTSVMAEKFVDAAAAGFKGSFDRGYKGRLMARAVTRRTVTYRPSNAVVFGQPRYGDLNPSGVRWQ